MKCWRTPGPESDVMAERLVRPVSSVTVPVSADPLSLAGNTLVSSVVLCAIPALLYTAGESDTVADELRESEAEQGLTSAAEQGLTLAWSVAGHREDSFPRAVQPSLCRSAACEELCTACLRR